jgi:hypothetical protein
MNVHERFSDYSGDKCWQGHLREVNYSQDLIDSGLTEEEIGELRTSDFTFEYVPKEDLERCKEVRLFIEKHEWLGKLPMSVTHRFTAKLKKTGQLFGVMCMATPNTFSSLLGKENRDLEKLLARGASLSLAPKNLGSWLIMQSVNWMVDNTDFRYFTGYSDPEAKELGTVYQACNFIYLGQTYGGTKQYLDPDKLERGWFGATGFSDRSQIIRYAKQLDIEWKPEWIRFVGARKYRKINWETIPEDITIRLKEKRKEHIANCEVKVSPRKHKYAYIKGRTKSETRHLIRLFESNNQKLLHLQYPKERGV